MPQSESAWRTNRPVLDAVIWRLAYRAAHLKNWSTIQKFSFSVACGVHAKNYGIPRKDFDERVWALVRSMQSEFEPVSVERPVNTVGTIKDLEKVMISEGIRRWLVNRTYEPEVGSDGERLVELRFASATRKAIDSLRTPGHRSADDIGRALLSATADHLDWWNDEDFNLSILLTSSSFYFALVGLRQMEALQEGQVFVEIFFDGNRRLIEFTQQARAMSLVIERQLLRLPQPETIAEDIRRA